MVLQKYTYDVKQRAIQEAFQACVDKLGIEYSRKRILKIVKEKSTYETKKFLENLEEMMGFPIHIVQVDNGHEFVNDNDKTSKESGFEKAAYNLGITIKRTRPY